MEKFTGIYQGTRPVIPGHPVWIMRFQTDKGKKIIKVQYNKLMDCLQNLDLHEGDKVKIIDEENSYQITKTD